LGKGTGGYVCKGKREGPIVMYSVGLSFTKMIASYYKVFQRGMGHGEILERVNAIRVRNGEIMLDLEWVTVRVGMGYS